MSNPFLSIFGVDPDTGKVFWTIGVASSIASTSASGVAVSLSATFGVFVDVAGEGVVVGVIFVNLASSGTSKPMEDIVCTGDDDSPDDIITLERKYLI